MTDGKGARTFLSCLRGSERVMGSPSSVAIFLSCLRGSELELEPRHCLARRGVQQKVRRRPN
jgi:hypothetical protein